MARCGNTRNCMAPTARSECPSRTRAATRERRVIRCFEESLTLKLLETPDRAIKRLANRGLSSLGRDAQHLMAPCLQAVLLQDFSRLSGGDLV